MNTLLVTVSRPRAMKRLVILLTLVASGVFYLIWTDHEGTRTSNRITRQTFQSNYTKALFQGVIKNFHVPSTIKAPTAHPQKPTYLSSTHNGFKLTTNMAPSNEPIRVIYNRVGKCGSRSFVEALSSIERYRDFKLILANAQLPVEISEDEQMKVIKLLNNTKHPFIYVRHLHMVDFENKVSWKPIRINVIRDPLERMMSQYYYHRFGDVQAPGAVVQYNTKERQQTFDECVLQNHSECFANSSKGYYIIPYFCGQHKYCRMPCRWALERAKNNVLSQYLAVGYIENMDPFLAILEARLPSFFRGVVYAWRQIMNEPKLYSNTIPYQLGTPSVKHKIT